MAKAATKTKPAPVPPKSEVEIFEDLEQGTPDWFEARRGLMTASNFAVIMREGKDGDASKTREGLLYDLAGEILSGYPAEETFKSAAMKRGNDMEPEAREYYERTNFATVRRVGFAKRKLPNGIIIGCSPDSLVGDDGALEIKTMIPKLLIPRILKGAPPPPGHRAQLHGNLWVLDRQWIDLLIFYRGREKPLQQKFRIQRDDVYIKTEIAPAIEQFDYELRQIVKSMGGSVSR